MAVFYSKEKSKVGTNTGTIIHWARELPTNDPEDQTRKELLPSGYLRCDGTVYSAEVFPELATILGTGQSCRFRKPTQTLLDNQFQVPDYGSKKLRASSGSNLGLEVDLRIEDDAGEDIVKSGVGLEVQSNIGTTYEIQYQGNFFLTSQQIVITGQPGFTRATGNYTETTEVLQTAFLPHAHFHDGTRTRLASSLGNEFNSIGRNFYTRKSTLCVTKSVGNATMPQGGWYENTYQPLCMLAAGRIRTATIDQASDPYGGGFGIVGRCIRYYYGACFTGCDFAGARYECLIPDGTSCGYPLWSGVTSGCAGGAGSADQDTCGTVQYTGTLFSKCECNGFAGVDPGNARAQRASQQLTPNYSDPTVPWDSVKTDDTPGYSAISNRTVEVESFGDEAIHRHFVNFSADPHTYVVNTTPAFIPAAPLVSTIQIQTNSQNKADQFIQPYIVQEFLIKF